ncbi:MAG: hypothetical protein IJC14_04270 [Firmicutes bacterium]|nr:hypothetical protein [Bacillota bacterium]
MKIVLKLGVGLVILTSAIVYILTLVYLPVSMEVKDYFNIDCKAIDSVEVTFSYVGNYGKNEVVSDERVIEIAEAAQNSFATKGKSLKYYLEFWGKSKNPRESYWTFNMKDGTEFRFNYLVLETQENGKYLAMLLRIGDYNIVEEYKLPVIVEGTFPGDMYNLLYEEAQTLNGTRYNYEYL